MAAPTASRPSGTRAEAPSLPRNPTARLHANSASGYRPRQRDELPAEENSWSQAGSESSNGDYLPRAVVYLHKRARIATDDESAEARKQRLAAERVARKRDKRIAAREKAKEKREKDRERCRLRREQRKLDQAKEAERASTNNHVQANNITDFSPRRNEGPSESASDAAASTGKTLRSGLSLSGPSLPGPQPEACILPHSDAHTSSPPLSMIPLPVPFVFPARRPRFPHPPGPRPPLLLQPVPGPSRLQTTAAPSHPVLGRPTLFPHVISLQSLLPVPVPVPVESPASARSGPSHPSPLSSVTSLMPSNSSSPLASRVPVPSTDGQSVTMPVLDRRLDLVSGIRGTCLSPKAGVVQWTGAAPRTVLPFLDDGKGSNVLRTDEALVRRFAAQRSSDTSTPSVLYLRSGDSDKAELVRTVRDNLSRGRFVVIRGFSGQDERVGLSTGELYEAFGLSAKLRLRALDVAKRSQDRVHPHVDTTLEDFVRDSTNSSRIRAVLDCPVPALSLLASLQALDDGLTVGWGQTNIAAEPRSQLHVENMMLRSSLSLYHAGVWIDVHHDADGVNTFVHVLSGHQCWSTVRLKDGMKAETYDDQINLYGKICSAKHQWINKEKGDLCLSYEDTCDIEVIHLRAGDLVFQPANSFHVVYTPVPSIAHRGYFYSYDNIHITELARTVDNMYGTLTVNQVRYHTYETIVRMVLALPWYPPARKLYRRALIALCTMVLQPTQYVAASAAEKAGPDSQMMKSAARKAKDIAEAVLCKLGFPSTRRVQMSLKELHASGSDWDDRGPEVELGNCLDEFCR